MVSSVLLGRCTSRNVSSSFVHSGLRRALPRAHVELPSRQFHSDPSTAFLRPRRLRRVLWLSAPVLGGAALLFAPSETAPLPHHILSHPTVIPCHDLCPSRKYAPRIHLMSSPREEPRSVLKIVITFLRDTVLEGLLTGVRFLHLVFLFSPVIVTSPMLLVGRPRRKGEDRWGAIWWYGLLVAQMQRAGPTFTKLAQWAASRRDLFPDELCARMGALHSGGKPHPFSHTKRLIEHAFNRPFSEVFEEFGHEPIGVGAIAQVYKATLNPSLIPQSYLDPKHKVPSPVSGFADAPRALSEYGRTFTMDQDAHPPTVPTTAVAIKVLHPRVGATIRRDLAIMAFFARCLSIIPGIEWISLEEEVQAFGGMMNEQLDLRHEAVNLRQFEKNFEGRRSAVTFPRPLEGFTTENVLVEEFQNALPLKTFLTHGGGPYDQRLASLGLDAFLNMLLLDNFVHSDLHPGNIMVKFYKPTTKFVYESISASLFGTKPPSSDLSPTDPPQHPNTDELTPSQESDKIVERLRPLSKDREAFLAELDKVAAEGYHPSLVFIDAGLVTTLNEENRRNFLDLFRAIAEFDGYRAGQLMVERCKTPELALEPETFALKMQHLVLGVKSKTFKLASIKISDVLTRVLLNVREHHVKMEAAFVNTVIAVLLLEGIGRQLDPDMDLFQASLPILRQLGSQVTARDALDQIPRGNFAAMLKIWVWIEARSLISSTVVDIDTLVKYDWLSPNI